MASTPSDTPFPPAPRPSALAFLAAALALYLPGMAAQGASLPLGLAWTQLFAFLLPAAALAAGSNLRPARFLGLSRWPGAGVLALGSLLGAAGFLAAAGLESLVISLAPEPWVRAFDLARLFEGPPLERAALAFLAAAVAPVCEEAAFRGYLQGALLGRLRPAAAIAVGAAAFAGLHLDPLRLAPVLGLGILFGWMTWRAGSVWPAVAAHAVNNGIAAALVLGREAAEPAEPGRGAALALLAAGCAAVAVLAAGYRAATARAPPLPGPDAVADPAGPSGFRWERVPVAYWGALLLGGVFLALLLS